MRKRNCDVQQLVFGQLTITSTRIEFVDSAAKQLSRLLSQLRPFNCAEFGARSVLIGAHTQLSLVLQQI